MRATPHRPQRILAGPRSEWGPVSTWQTDAYAAETRAKVSATKAESAAERARLAQLDERREMLSRVQGRLAQRWAKLTAQLEALAGNITQLEKVRDEALRHEAKQARASCIRTFSVWPASLHGGLSHQ